MTPQDERALIDLLGKMGTQWSPELYNALAPHFALTAIEVVCLRKVGEDIQVYLAKRPDNDAYWPGQWHSPGTMLRASDVPEETSSPGDIPPMNGFVAPLARLTKSELGIQFKAAPRQVGTIFHWTPREPEVALIFVAELEGEPKTGQYFNVKQLPPGLIWHHYRVIAAAVAAY